MEIESDLCNETVQLLCDFRSKNVISENSKFSSNNSKYKKKENSKQQQSLIMRPPNKDYLNLSQQFIVKSDPKNYVHQYWEMYEKRLSEIKQFFDSKDINLQDRIVNIQPGEMKVIIATLFKQTSTKPSPFRQQAENIIIIDSDISVDLSPHQDDLLFMEDSSGRMQLAFNKAFLENSSGVKIPVDVHSFTTGCVVGIVGIQRVAEINVFETSRLFTASFPHQENILNLNPFQSHYLSANNNIHDNFHQISHYLNSNNDDPFVLLTSGLSIDEKNEHSISILNSLKTHLFGLHNCKQLISRVCRVVVAGNLIENESVEDMSEIGCYKMQQQFKSYQMSIVSKMREVNKQLSEVFKGVFCDVMPGENDPTNSFWPQSPINKCYFLNPLNSKQSTLQLVSNPYRFQLHDIDILGTTGLNFKDGLKHCSIGSNDIDLLESHIQLRHIAPTAPDTIPCYPFQGHDPFVVQELPHVYFVGNCRKFETKMIFERQGSLTKRCRLICIPSLSATSSFVLLNLKNLDTFSFQL